MDQYRISSSEWEEDVRQLRKRLTAAGLFLLAVLLCGIVGYWTIDPSAGLVDALYMTVITLTTVGFEEVIDLGDHPGGRVFTVVLILVGMGGVLYFISTATAFVLEGQLGHVFRKRRMQRAIERLSDHLIVAGSGGTAIHTAQELVSVRRPVVMVCESPDRGERVRRELPDTPIIFGDPASDDILVSAGVERAAGLVACTDNDKENLVVTLAARQLNSGMRIVTRVSDPDAEAKVRKVGADAVVAPTLIGGLRLASELIRPTVVSFLDIMLRDRDLNLRVDEILIPDGAKAVGKTVGDLDIGNISDALLLACRTPDGSWIYNPRDDREMEAGEILVLLGSPGDVLAVSKALGGQMVSAPVSPSPA